MPVLDPSSTSAGIREHTMNKAFILAGLISITLLVSISAVEAFRIVMAVAECGGCN
jgi:hypothetical protein